jgi:hypothetical protein
MGSIFAIGLAESVQTRELKLRQAIETHLRNNHFLSIPYSMNDPCIRAIKYANRGEWDKHVRSSEGVTYRKKSYIHRVPGNKSHEQGESWSEILGAAILEEG